MTRASDILYGYVLESIKGLAEELQERRSRGRPPEFVFIDARVAHILDILHSIEKLEKM